MALDFPAAPSIGTIFSGGGSSWRWDGTKWVPAKYGTFTISDTAPSAPNPSDMWFDSIGCQTYIWYTDPTSSQWVPLVNQLGGTVVTGVTPPPTPQPGTLWFDANGGQLYLYFNDGNSSQWVAVSSVGSIGTLYGAATFLSTGTFVTAANSTSQTVYRFRMVGGGGGGGGTASPAPTFGGGGGGGGEFVEGTFTGIAPNVSIPITVGAGGNGGSTAGGAGANGGNSTISGSIGVFAVGGGGGGGAVGSTAAFAGAGGTGGVNGNANVLLRIAGTFGGEGIQPSNGQMVYGGPGGNSMMGIASYGVAYGFGATGSTGMGYGIGGGGAISTAYAGGAGTAGIVIIERVAG